MEGPVLCTSRGVICAINRNLRSVQRLICGIERAVLERSRTFSSSRRIGSTISLHDSCNQIWTVGFRSTLEGAETPHEKKPSSVGFAPLSLSLSHLRDRSERWGEKRGGSCRRPCSWWSRWSDSCTTLRCSSSSTTGWGSAPAPASSTLWSLAGLPSCACSRSLSPSSPIQAASLPLLLPKRKTPRRMWVNSINLRFFVDSLHLSL